MSGFESVRDSDSEGTLKGETVPDSPFGCWKNEGTLGGSVGFITTPTSDPLLLIV
jgi:hypothetical protein